MSERDNLNRNNRGESPQRMANTTTPIHLSSLTILQQRCKLKHPAGPSYHYHCSKHFATFKPSHIADLLSNRQIPKSTWSQTPTLNIPRQTAISMRITKEPQCNAPNWNYRRSSRGLKRWPLWPIDNFQNFGFSEFIEVGKMRYVCKYRYFQIERSRLPGNVTWHYSSFV